MLTTLLQCGTADEDGRVVMPLLLPLTSERLVRYGLFLLEDGHSMFLWIGRDAVPQLLMDVFDKPSYDQLPPSGKVRDPLALLIILFVVLLFDISNKTHSTHRSPFRLLTTPSPSALMRLLITPERCVEGRTGHSFT